jgi:hypothetical protein
MTDPIDVLRRLVLESQAKGHSSMILSVARPVGRRQKRAPRERVQIARGLTGRWVGDLQDGREGHIVDVSVADVVAWLKRRDKTATQPVNQ